MKEKFSQVFDWLFRDKAGNIVVGQTPNWPLYLYIAFYLLRFTNLELLQKLSLWGGRISLSYWAYLEITQGVNGFRKILGTIVLFTLIIPLLIP